MEQVYRLETTLSGDLAALYAAVMEEFEAKSSIPLAEMNRTLLQTGMIHHLAMLVGLGLVDGERRARIEALTDAVARDTIMWDVLELARAHWRDQGGTMGTIDFKA